MVKVVNRPGIAAVTDYKSEYGVTLLVYRVTRGK